MRNVVNYEHLIQKAWMERAVLLEWLFFDISIKLNFLELPSSQSISHSGPKFVTKVY